VGDTAIEVASTAGFVKGDTIKVGTEYQLVKGYGSIYLDHPMNTAQPVGAKVSVIHDVAPPPPAAAAAPPAIAARAVGTPVPVVGGPTTTAPYTSSSGFAPLSGSTQGTVLAVSLGLVGCCCLFACVIGLYFMFGRGKKKRKAQPRQETPFVGDYPEDQQPLNGQASMMSTMVDMQQSAPDLCESQYMQVQVPPLQPVQASVYSGNIGSVPTMQNVVPMQTMPPPPPMAPMSMSYAPQGQGSYFSQGQGSAYIQQGQGSMYQNASPLANTVSAVPAQYTGAFQSYQNVPPTIY